MIDVTDRPKAMSGWCLTGKHPDCWGETDMWRCSCSCHEAEDSPSTMEV